MALDGMMQRHFTVDEGVVGSAPTLPADEACLFKVVQDCPDPIDVDACRSCDGSSVVAWIARQHDEHMCVIAKERPVGHAQQLTIPERGGSPPSLADDDDIPF